MDFGVARLSGQGTTTAGTIVGTPNYMSPEQVSGGELDGRSDLFSAGLILYELVTGEKAIRAETVVSAMYKILHESPDLALIPTGEAWRRLRGVLERALARRPDERFPDARAMAAELAQALVDLGGTADWSMPADQALLVRPKPLPPLPAPSASGGATTIGAAPTARADARPAPAGEPRGGRARAAAAVATPAASGTRRWLAAGTAAALVALGTGAFFVFRPSERSATGEPRAPSPSAAATSTAPSPATAVPSPAATTPGKAAAAEKSPPAASSREPATPEPTPPVAGGVEPEAATARPAAVLSPEARLIRARDMVARQRWAEALAESRAVLEAQPTSREATALAQQAEAELVVEECLGNARAALRAGDRERAIDELRRGFLVRKDDPRLLALHREAVQQ
jgi:hypothetical protein